MRGALHLIYPLLSDRFFNVVQYYAYHKKCGLLAPRIDFDSPRRFNHKMIWLKMNYRHPDAALYADKVLVKEWVAHRINADIVIPNLGVWEAANDIDFSDLPESFVLKANHGSGWNILVDNKRTIDEQDVKYKLNQWLKKNFADIGREYQYKAIPPRILAEPILDPGDGKSPQDYKFFCFDGEPRFLQVDVDRQVTHARNYYDLSWNRLPFQRGCLPHATDCQKPDNFEKMVAIARQLSVGFPFVRVDLYDVLGSIYFGELTFHAGGGFVPIQPDAWDERLGDMLTLPC